MINVKLTDQTYTFLCSLLCGVFLGLLYVLFKCLRKIFSNRKVPTVILDVLYMLIFSFATILFSIGFTNGFVRYYVVAGEIAGAIAFRFTMGILIYKLFEVTYKAFMKVKGIFLKNISVILKKLLKARHKMLYNKVNKKAKSAN